jgi:hypothetical protein
MYGINQVHAVHVANIMTLEEKKAVLEESNALYFNPDIELKSMGLELSKSGHAVAREVCGHFGVEYTASIQNLFDALFPKKGKRVGHIPFDWETAIKIAKEYNISMKTLRVWKHRRKIPGVYIA